MFVRWQRKTRARTSDWGPLLCAVLVESHRIDGKPRQQTVAYLGSIREGLVNFVTRRGYFWRDVTQTLDGLGERVSRDDRAKIEASISEKVPALTPAEHSEANEILATYGQPALPRCRVR